MKLSQLRSEITDEGTWKKLIDWPGVEVLVRTTDHPDYARALNSSLERRGRAARKDSDAKEEIVLRAVAKHLILNWKGVTDDNDQPIEFDRALVVGWAKDLRGYGRFLRSVLNAAIEATDDLVEEREELGNS